MMLHHTMIFKSATCFAVLAGPSGMIRVEDADPVRARAALLTKAQDEIVEAPVLGAEDPFRLELCGAVLATGKDRDETRRRAVAVISRMLMAAQTDRPVRSLVRSN